MSVSAPKNTMLYQRKGRPLAMARDISSALVRDVTPPMRLFGKQHGSSTVPEVEAISFYLANHAMKELEFAFGPEEPLPDWAMEIADAYHRTASTIAARAFYYLLLITAREARHNHKKHEMTMKMENEFGKGPAMALLHYPDQSSIEAVAAVFDEYAGDAPLGDVVRSICHVFYQGSFGAAYGGPKWGNIADCLVAYVTGQYTAEMMLDTVWTLSHNGGPIFNKGMLYGMYNQTALVMILDIQRAGQIPRLVMTPYGNGVVAEQYVKPHHKEFAKKVAARLPDGDFKPGVPVCFKELKALGAVGSYSHLTALTPPAAAKPIPSSVPVAASVVTEKSHYTILPKPGFQFKKLTRAQLKEA